MYKIKIGSYFSGSSQILFALGSLWSFIKIFFSVAVVMFLSCHFVSISRRGRLHKTLLAVADEVGSACFGEGFADEVGVLGAVVLKERALELFFVVVGYHVDLLHIKRVDSCVVHYRRRRAGGRVEVLNLLGGIVIAL